MNGDADNAVYLPFRKGTAQLLETAGIGRHYRAGNLKVLIRDGRHGIGLGALINGPAHIHYAAAALVAYDSRPQLFNNAKGLIHNAVYARAGNQYAQRVLIRLVGSLSGFPLLPHQLEHALGLFQLVFLIQHKVFSRKNAAHLQSGGGGGIQLAQLIKLCHLAALLVEYVDGFPKLFVGYLHAEALLQRLLKAYKLFPPAFQRTFSVGDIGQMNNVHLL